jgi:hypothetical protein
MLYAILSSNKEVLCLPLSFQGHRSAFCSGCLHHVPYPPISHWPPAGSSGPIWVPQCLCPETLTYALTLPDKACVTHLAWSHHLGGCFLISSLQEGRPSMIRYWERESPSCDFYYSIVLRLLYLTSVIVNLFPCLVYKLNLLRGMCM